MKVITIYDYSFSFVPLLYPQVSDELTIELRNEISNLLLILPTYWVENLGRIYLTIPSPQPDFAIGNKYSIVIKNGLIPIYYGKLTVLDESTDIQNFKYGNSFYTE